MPNSDDVLRPLIVTLTVHTYMSELDLMLDDGESIAEKAKSYIKKNPLKWLANSQVNNDPLEVAVEPNGIVIHFPTASG